MFVLALALLVGTTVLAEFRSYAQPDIAFLLDAGGRVLDGARLYVDVVEINPPLVIALNVAVVWIARTLGLSEILVYRVGFTAVLLGSLWLTAGLLRGLLGHDLRLRRVLVVAIALVLFPLAGVDFGEREHLVLALLLPYLLLATGRLAGRAMANAPAAALGLLAGLAIALKPHFILVWFAIEVLLRGSRKVRPRAILPESLAVAGFLVTYVLLILLLTPAYVDLLRLLAIPYAHFLHEPFLQLLVTGPGAVLAVFALLAFAALRPQARHPAVWAVFALATAACLVAGAAQQKGLRYHFYPAFSLATVVLALVSADGVIAVHKPVRAIYRSLVAGVLAATVTVACVRQALRAVGREDDPGRAQFERLVDVVRSRAQGAGVFVMSYHLQSAYPLINYAHARSASRFPHLWLLAAEYLDALKGDRPLQFHEPAEMSPGERYLNRAVLEDLGRRPRLLVVFRNARDLPVNGFRRLDYIAYFGRDAAIGSILREYQLVAQTGDYLVYQWVPASARRVEAAPRPTPGTADAVPVAGGGRGFAVGDPVLLAGVLAFLGGVAAAWRSNRVPREDSSSPQGSGQPRLVEGAPGE